MPGFNVGINASGPSNTTEIRRVYRWMFQTLGRGAGVFSPAELLMLKTASRPHPHFDELKRDYNQEEAWYAGKTHWEPIELTWYDGEQNPDISAGIYAWLEAVSRIDTVQVAVPVNYKRYAELAMLNAAGAPCEVWRLYGAWGQDFDWKPLDHTQAELANVSVKMRFDRAVRACLGSPAQPPIAPSCPITV